MSLRLFELLSLVTVGVTLLAMARRRPTGALLVDYASLAVAGFVGEESMIVLYRFYSYDRGWDLRLVDVPALVPLIWPLVILSAREVAHAMAPRLGPVARAALVGGLVVFDASLVEVVAVRAGLWSWAEPGHLGVPLVGILGWGFFAFSAVLPRFWLASAPSRAARAWALVLPVVVGPLGAHLLVLASWWGLFRWTLRGDLGSTPARILVAAALPVAGALLLRRRGHTFPLAVAAPRILAASLFVALLFANAGGESALVAHAVLVGAPYSLLTRPWSFAVPRDQSHEFC